MNRSSYPSDRSLLIGVDVDGVVADLVGPVLDAIHCSTGRRFTEHDVVHFNLSSILGEEAWTIAHQNMCSPGFATSLKPYPGALEGVHRLRQLGRVVFVTSPLPQSPTWSFDRASWLIRHLDTRPEDIAHLLDKSLFGGDVLIDDAPINLETWVRSGRFAVRVDRPWNQNAPGVIARSWHDIVTAVEDFVGRRDAAE